MPPSIYTLQRRIGHLKATFHTAYGEWETALVNRDSNDPEMGQMSLHAATEKVARCLAALQGTELAVVRSAEAATRRAHVLWAIAGDDRAGPAPMAVHKIRCKLLNKWLFRIIKGAFPSIIPLKLLRQQLAEFEADARWLWTSPAEREFVNVYANVVSFQMLCLVPAVAETTRTYARRNKLAALLFDYTKPVLKAVKAAFMTDEHNRLVRLFYAQAGVK
jgi:hypothetical protein